MSANEDEGGLRMSQPCGEWEALRMAAVSAGRWAARRLAQRCSTWQLGRTGEVSVHVGPGDSPVAEWSYQLGHAVAGQPGSGVLVPVELTDQDLHPAEDAVRKARSLLVRYAYASAYGSVLAEEAGVTTKVRMEATEHSGPPFRGRGPPTRSLSRPTRSPARALADPAGRVLIPREISWSAFSARPPVRPSARPPVRQFARPPVRQFASSPFARFAGRFGRSARYPVPPSPVNALLGARWGTPPRGGIVARWRLPAAVRGHRAQQKRRCGVSSSNERSPDSKDGLPSSQLPDADPDETREWLESLDQVVDAQGASRARHLMLRLVERAREHRVGVPGLRSTDYINSIPPGSEPPFPGDEHVERRIRAYIRWNAAVMVSRANRPEVGVGGHIATYASAASLYEVGFNHFFRGKAGGDSGDQVFIQGHASPGIYARAYLEGRLTQRQLDGFRQELSHSGGGLPSYPHPRLMPDFWEFPTVTMGLSPINAIYQARFNRYLHNRGIRDTSGSHVWAFLGDGEMAEPESLGQIDVASREELDNLTFVINCNLQQLDGPVRGNGKIVQELESMFRGAGWNVIKVLWGRDWDPLLARDVDGALVDRMNTTPDGQFQTYSVSSGDYIREHFFGGDERLRRMVEEFTDEGLQRLSRGGHDYRKVYAAFRAAREHVGQPTVILTQTVKGWALGPDFEGRNATHQMKKLTSDELKTFRDRLYLPIPDEALERELPPYYHPGANSREMEYMRQRREALDGFVPERVVRPKPVKLPGDEVYSSLRRGSGEQSVATTMAFVRLLRELMKDEDLGARFVPIIPDEARTFGMDSLFPTGKIYSPAGMNYEAVDSEMLLSWQESTSGQVLHEGISEAGAMGSTIAAGTCYATHGEHMIPVYVFYSMFGFQRTGDLLWALGDQMGRGFLLGATAGRTTLNGEGLQHQDGQSPLLAASNPACVHYDPAWAFEVSAVVRDGLRRMYGSTAEHPHGENVFYYLTLYNDPYRQPPEPEGDSTELQRQILRGLYRYRPAPSTQDAGGSDAPRAQILASGVAMPWALEAQRRLAEEWGVAADVWSATSWNELRRDAVECDEWNLRHPEEARRSPHVTTMLNGCRGPVVAVSDFMRAVPDQIAPWVPGDYLSLGTDGFGRSDMRVALRRHFRVDAPSITVAVLNMLEQRGQIEHETLQRATRHHRLHDEQAAQGAVAEAVRESAGANSDARSAGDDDTAP